MAKDYATRTDPEYATRGPADTGESWAEYFRRVRGSGDDHTAGDGGDQHISERTRKIVRSGRGLDELPEEWPSPNSGLGYLKLLENSGFHHAEMWSEWLETGGVYGDSAQKAGQPYPDRHGCTVTIEAYRPGKLIKLQFETNSAGKWVCTWRQLNKQYMIPSDAEVKEWIKNASDAEVKEWIKNAATD